MTPFTDKFFSKTIPFGGSISSGQSVSVKCGVIFFLQKSSLTKKNIRLFLLNGTIRYQGFDYYEVIISVGAWSNPIKLEGFYDSFDHAPTEIITS